ncbi:MAG: DUF2911 domain-containing protein [Candidatus Dadabacteria bacterium]
MRTSQIILTVCIVFCLAITSNAQKLPDLDVSPADISIFRPDGRGTEPVAKVVYGRPQMKGRIMIGGTEPYGKVWRTGANESTEIRFYRDVTVGDQKVKAGTYTLYTIPNKDQWTIILNSKLDTWGAFEYDQSKDVIRTNVPVTATDKNVEAFSIVFEGKQGTGNMDLAWEKWMVKVPLKY